MLFLSAKMCDNSGVLTVPELTQNWICLAKMKSGSNTGVQSTMQPNNFSTSDEASVSDADLENVLPFLDSPLRPATPDLNDPRSLAFYEEHKQLAREYFKVQSELVFVNQEKNRIVDKQLKQQQQQEESESLAKLQNEYESLVQLKNFLVSQKEGHNLGGRSATDGWEVVNRTDSEC